MHLLNKAVTYNRASNKLKDNFKLRGRGIVGCKQNSIEYIGPIS